MKEEDFVKRLVQLAEEFKLIVIDYHIRVTFATGIVLIKNIREWQFYPLLLYRAKEGLNKQSNRRGIEDVSGNHWMIINLNDCKTLKAIKHSDYQPTEYLTQQEQALEEALKEVLK